jgi:hypothetical protein
LLALLFSGCGRLGGSVSTTSGADASSPAVVEAEKLFDEIAHGVLPTPAQAEAVRYLEHVTFQAMIVDCMTGKGFVYVAPPAFKVPSPVARWGGGALPPVDPAAVEADRLGLNATVAGLIENAKAGEPIVVDTGGTDDPIPPEHEVPGWSEAESACSPSIKALDARVAHPAYERAQPFTDMVERVLDSQPVSGAMTAYPMCMRAEGWPVKARHELVWSVRGRFEDLLVDAADSFSTDPDRRTAQVDQVVRSAEWNRLVEARTDAASADASCRRDAHDLAFAALLDPLRSFKAEHDAEIEQLRAEWAAFEERANQTPDPARR